MNVEWIETNKQEPRHGHNVLVIHTIYFQDFITRAFLSGNKWVVMTWHGTDNVKKEDIKFWMPLPRKEEQK